MEDKDIRVKKLEKVLRNTLRFLNKFEIAWEKGEFYNEEITDDIVTVISDIEDILKGDNK